MSLQLIDRLVELPYRIRRAARADSPTWVLTKEELGRISLVWPSTYQWQDAKGITETLKLGLEHLGVLTVGQIPQTHRGIIMLACRVDDRPSLIALDYSDSENFINEAALAECSLYIKLECREGGYEDARIIPGGYPVTGIDYYRYYRPYRARYATHRAIDVLGRFGYRFQGEIRKRAVQMLSDAAGINFVGRGKKVRYSRFLREAASARLSLHLPGNGPFTHRVAEFLGLGTCMISPTFPTALHVALKPGVHYVAVADDLSDLVDSCRYYLAHDAEREAIARAGREFFDRYLHCDHLGAYYVRNAIDRLGVAQPS
jgi:glycosyl transferase family 1